MSSFSHGDIASRANCGCAKMPYYDCKRVPVTSNHDEWKRFSYNVQCEWQYPTQSGVDPNIESVIGIVIQMGSWSTTFLSRAERRRQSIDRWITRLQLYTSSHAPIWSISAKLTMKSSSAASSPIFCVPSPQDEWTEPVPNPDRKTNKCRSVGTITYFLGPSLPHSARIAKRIESVKLLCSFKYHWKNFFHVWRTLRYGV